MNLNKAIIVGRLTQDPETRTLPSGQPVASFSIASNRNWTDQGGNKQEAAEFHNIVVFGKLADICSQYLSKGRLVLIEGRIQTRSWEGKDGNRRYRTEIVAENMQMGPRPMGDQGQARQQEAPKQGRGPDSEDVGDIPVIEAEEPIKANEENDSEQNDSEQKEGVDIQNIPF